MCIEAALLSKQECPVCRRALTAGQLRTDINLRRKAWSQRVPCGYQRLGCGWKGEIGEDGKTVRAHELGCGFNRVPCSDCKAEIQASGKKEHDQVCPAALVPCPFSGCSLPRMRRDAYRGHMKEEAGAHLELLRARFESAQTVSETLYKERRTRRLAFRFDKWSKPRPSHDPHWGTFHVDGCEHKVTVSRLMDGRVNIALYRRGPGVVNVAVAAKLLATGKNAPITPGRVGCNFSTDSFVDGAVCVLGQNVSLPAGCYDSTTDTVTFGVVAAPDFNTLGWLDDL